MEEIDESLARVDAEWQPSTAYTYERPPKTDEELKQEQALAEVVEACFEDFRQEQALAKLIETCFEGLSIGVSYAGEQEIITRRQPPSNRPNYPA
jgi:hypothetical protein